MFSSKQLSEDQKNALHQWAAEGASIADLQKRLKDEFDIGITYMDARFMVLDLGIEIAAPPEDEPEKQEVELEAPAGASTVGVTMDSIAVPGAMISGKVTFSDGETAIWMIDPQGRPALDPDTPGYRPSQEDVVEFQKQLTELVRSSGL